MRGENVKRSNPSSFERPTVLAFVQILDRSIGVHSVGRGKEHGGLNARKELGTAVVAAVE
jgi:hypothetical protein